MENKKKYEVTLEFDVHTIDLVTIEVETTSTDHWEIVELAKQEFDRREKAGEDINFVASDFLETSYGASAIDDFQVEEIKNENS